MQTDRKIRLRVIEDGLMRTGEAAKFLGVSYPVLYQLMDSGELPFVTVGKQRRVPRRAVTEFVLRNLFLADSVKA